MNRNLKKIHPMRTWTSFISQARTSALEPSIASHPLRNNSYRLSQIERRANKVHYSGKKNFRRIKKRAKKPWLRRKNTKNTKVIRSLTLIKTFQRGFRRTLTPSKRSRNLRLMRPSKKILKTTQTNLVRLKWSKSWRLAARPAATYWLSLMSTFRIQISCTG